MEKHSLRFQGRDEVYVGGSSNVGSSKRKKERKKKKSGDGRNKYLKERLPSQLHRA